MEKPLSLKKNGKNTKTLNTSFSTIKQRITPTPKVFKEKYGWEDGDEIITTPLTFVSTNHFMYENLKIFADVDDSLCLDPESVLTNITDKTKTVMFVGIGGNIGQYNKIREICDLQNIPLILDAVIE